MISAELPSVKPMPAAAQPEYELSIEITTGMSAPPIGMMISAPNTKAIERDQPEVDLALRHHETVDEEDQRQRRARC